MYDLLSVMAFIQYTMSQRQSAHNRSKLLKTCSKTVHSVFMDRSSHMQAYKYILEKGFFILISGSFLDLRKGCRDKNGWSWKIDDDLWHPN